MTEQGQIVIKCQGRSNLAQHLHCGRYKVSKLNSSLSVVELIVDSFKVETVLRNLEEKSFILPGTLPSSIASC